ncbi:MAG: hypothetical protein U0271_43390 [Polyangiaceae bacterium]
MSRASGPSATAAALGPTASPVEPAEWPKRFKNEKLEGWILAPRIAVAATTAEGARTLVQSKLLRDDLGEMNLDLYRVVEDEGDVVRIQWVTRREHLPEAMRAAFRSGSFPMDIEAYFRRDLLAPVLKKSQRVEFSDGTGYVVYSGTPLTIVKGRFAVGDYGLRTLPVSLGEDDVALSFQMDAHPPALTALRAPLGCRSWRREGDSREPTEEAAIVGPLEELAQEHWERTSKDPYIPGWSAEYPVTCGLIGTDPLMMDGRPVGISERVDNASGSSLTRVADKLLMTVPVQYGVVRVQVTEASLRVGWRGEGWGLGSIGCLGAAASCRKSKVTYRVAPGPLTLSDGTSAGDLLEPLDVADPRTEGALLCTTIDGLVGELCFPKSRAKRK